MLENRDLHSIWPHRWITPKAESFQSPIGGLGVVAVDDIGRGEVIGVLGGVVVPRSQILEYREKYGMGHGGIQVDDDFFIVPTTRDELAETGILNHGCSPNVGFKNSVIYMAIKDVRKGQELLVDYAFMESDFEPFQCNCGSPECRREIKPSDWQIPKLQEKYGDYFSPYLRAKFSNNEQRPLLDR